MQVTSVCVPCMCATCMQAPTEAKRHGMDSVEMQFQSVVTHPVWVLEAIPKCSGRGAHLTTSLLSGHVASILINSTAYCLTLKVFSSSKSHIKVTPGWRPLKRSPQLWQLWRALEESDYLSCSLLTAARLQEATRDE